MKAKVKREKWQRPDSLLQLSTSKLKSIIESTNGIELILSGITSEERANKYDENQLDNIYERLDEYNNNSEYHDLKNHYADVAIMRVKKLLSSAIHKKKTKAQVISQARNSQERIFLLREHSIEVM